MSHWQNIHPDLIVKLVRESGSANSQKLKCGTLQPQDIFSLCQLHDHINSGRRDKTYWDHSKWNGENMPPQHCLPLPWLHKGCQRNTVWITGPLISERILQSRRATGKQGRSIDTIKVLETFSQEKKLQWLELFTWKSQFMNRNQLA